MSDRTVDLRSDTTTRPTAAMFEAMARAAVGDDAFGEDPTVRRLQQKAAAMLGKEAALYVPSGTMGNHCALLAHVGEGDAVFFEERAHLFGGTRRASWNLAGALPHPLQAELGVPDPRQLEEAVNAARAKGQRPALVCIENTHNHSGGYAWAPEEVEAVTAQSRELGMKVHMDGARLFNAAVAMGVEAEEYARHADSVMFCLSKGLGAPVGSMLCGGAQLVEKARAVRSSLGGTMRQAGVVAAAGLVALEGMVERLAEDHRRARVLCAALQGLDGWAVRQPPNPTNFVMLESAAPGEPARGLCDELKARGVLGIARPPAKVRLVLHRHIDDDDVEFTAAAVREAAVP